MLEARGRLTGVVGTSAYMSGELAAGECGRVGSSLAPVSEVSGVWKLGEGGAGAGRTGVLAGTAGAIGWSGGAGSNSSSLSSRKVSKPLLGMENRNGSRMRRVTEGEVVVARDVLFASSRAGQTVPIFQLLT